MYRSSSAPIRATAPPARPCRFGAGRRTFTIRGGRYGIPLCSDETNGEISVLDLSIAPGGASPPHYHTRETEGFYILEGRLTFTVVENGAQRQIVAEPHTFLHVPRFVVHNFRNEADTPARMICFFTPGGYESYFLDVADWLAAHSQTVADPAEVARVFAGFAGRYGTVNRQPGDLSTPGGCDCARGAITFAARPEEPEAETLLPCGNLLRVLAGSEQTCGRYFARTETVPPGGSALPHIHRQDSETFFVLEGDLVFTLPQNAAAAAPAGTALYVPGGTSHSFHNPSPDTVARVLVVATPGEGEGFYRAMRQPGADMALAADRFGVEALDFPLLPK